MGPSGKKRRKLDLQFKIVVGIRAMETKRANTVSSMLLAVALGLQKNCHRIVSEQLWHYKAEVELASQQLPVIHVASDGCRVGKHAKEYLGVYLRFRRDCIVACLHQRRLVELSNDRVM